MFWPTVRKNNTAVHVFSRMQIKSGSKVLITPRPLNIVSCAFTHVNRLYTHASHRNRGVLFPRSARLVAVF